MHKIRKKHAGFSSYPPILILWGFLYNVSHPSSLHLLCRAIMPIHPFPPLSSFSFCSCFLAFPLRSRCCCTFLLLVHIVKLPTRGSRQIRAEGHEALQVSQHAGLLWGDVGW